MPVVQRYQAIIIVKDNQGQGVLNKVVDKLEESRRVLQLLLWRLPVERDIVKGGSLQMRKLWGRDFVLDMLQYGQAHQAHFHMQACQLEEMEISGR